MSGLTENFFRQRLTTHDPIHLQQRSSMTTNMRFRRGSSSNSINSNNHHSINHSSSTGSSSTNFYYNNESKRYSSELNSNLNVYSSSSLSSAGGGGINNNNDPSASGSSVSRSSSFYNYNNSSSSSRQRQYQRFTDASSTLQASSVAADTTTDRGVGSRGVSGSSSTSSGGSSTSSSGGSKLSFRKSSMGFSGAFQHYARRRQAAIRKHPWRTDVSRNKSSSSSTSSSMSSSSGSGGRTLWRKLVTRQQSQRLLNDWDEHSVCPSIREEVGVDDDDVSVGPRQHQLDQPRSVAVTTAPTAPLDDDGDGHTRMNTRKNGLSRSSSSRINGFRANNNYIAENVIREGSHSENSSEHSDSDNDSDKTKMTRNCEEKTVVDDDDDHHSVKKEKTREELLLEALQERVKSVYTGDHVIVEAYGTGAGKVLSLPDAESAAKREKLIVALEERLNRYYTGHLVSIEAYGQGGAGDAAVGNFGALQRPPLQKKNNDSDDDDDDDARTVASIDESVASVTSVASVHSVQSMIMAATLIKNPDAIRTIAGYAEEVQQDPERNHFSAGGDDEWTEYTLESSAVDLSHGATLTDKDDDDDEWEETTVMTSRSQQIAHLKASCPQFLQSPSPPKQQNKPTLGESLDMLPQASPQQFNAPRPHSPDMDKSAAPSVRPFRDLFVRLRTRNNSKDDDEDDHGKGGITDDDLDDVRGGATSEGNSGENEYSYWNGTEDLYFSKTADSRVKQNIDPRVAGGIGNKTSDRNDSEYSYWNTTEDLYLNKSIDSRVKPTKEDGLTAGSGDSRNQEYSYWNSTEDLYLDKRVDSRVKPKKKTTVDAALPSGASVRSNNRHLSVEEAPPVPPENVADDDDDWEEYTVHTLADALLALPQASKVQDLPSARTSNKTSSERESAAGPTRSIHEPSVHNDGEIEYEEETVADYDHKAYRKTMEDHGMGQNGYNDEDDCWDDYTVETMADAFFSMPERVQLEFLRTTRSVNSVAMSMSAEKEQQQPQADDGDDDASSYCPYDVDDGVNKNVAEGGSSYCTPERKKMSSTGSADETWHNARSTPDSTDTNDGPDRQDNHHHHELSSRGHEAPGTPPRMPESRLRGSDYEEQDLLADLLQRDIFSEDKEVVAGVLRFLARKAAEDFERCAQAVELGGLLGIVRAMERNVDHAEIQMSACRALENLALDQVQKMAIIEVGGVEAAIGAISAHMSNADVAEAACWALLILTSDCDTKELTIEVASVDVIVTCMKEHDRHPHIQEKAFRTLANLCLDNKDRLIALSRIGGFVVMSAALVQHWENPSVKSEAITTLSRLFGKLAEYQDSSFG